MTSNDSNVEQWEKEVRDYYDRVTVALDNGDDNGYHSDPAPHDAWGVNNSDPSNMDLTWRGSDNETTSMGMDDAIEIDDPVDASPGANTNHQQQLQPNAPAPEAINATAHLLAGVDRAEVSYAPGGILTAIRVINPLTGLGIDIDSFVHRESTSSKDQENDPQPEGDRKPAAKKKRGKPKTFGTKKSAAKQPTPPANEAIGRDKKPADQEEEKERGYWVGQKVKDSVFGCVRHSTILDRQENNKWFLTKQSAAAKVVSHQLRKMPHTENPEQEVKTLQHLQRLATKHLNVGQVLDILQNDDFIYIFMPFYASGCLHDLVIRNPNRRLEQDIARFWFCQILKGLEFLHQNGVCHWDMTLENVVIDPVQRQAKIIDFGLSRVLSHAGDLVWQNQITPDDICGKYIPPEIFQDHGTIDAYAVDLWGAATMLFVLLVGKEPWVHPSKNETGYRIIAHWPFPDNRAEILEETGVERYVQAFGRNLELDADAYDLLQRMLRHDPGPRLARTDAVNNHSWVRNGDTEATSAELLKRVDAWIRQYGVPKICEGNYS